MGEQGADLSAATLQSQRDNGDYSDLIPIKGFFCERARPTHRRNGGANCAELRNFADRFAAD
jgi:hypothetical protein